MGASWQAMQGMCLRQVRFRGKQGWRYSPISRCRIYENLSGKDGKTPLSVDNGAALSRGVVQGICTSMTPSALTVTWLVPASICGVGAASIIAMPLASKLRMAIGGWKLPVLRLRLTSL